MGQFQPYYCNFLIKFVSGICWIIKNVMKIGKSMFDSRNSYKDNRILLYILLNIFYRNI